MKSNKNKILPGNCTKGREKCLVVITPTRCIHIEVAFIAHYSIIYILHHTYFPTESCINPEKPEENCITVLQANLYKAIPFFLHLGSIPTDPNLVFILQEKGMT